MGNQQAALLSRLTIVSFIDLYTTVGKIRRQQLTQWSTRLTDYTPSKISLGYTYRKLIPSVWDQAGVSDRGLQDSRAERGTVTGWLAAYIPEWLVDSWVLGHIGGWRREKDQAQDNNEEWQQIKAGKLQHRDRETQRRLMTRRHHVSHLEVMSGFYWVLFLAHWSE